MKIVEQGVWALGCIGGDNHLYRNIIIDEEGIPSLLRALENTKNKDEKNIVYWTLSNLSRGTPLPEYEKIKSVI